MIAKSLVLNVATEAKVPGSTIERDYVLGWVLWAIAKEPSFSNWVFKGGTCLKKCYFDTYRFSEDLDFTVKDGGIYSQQEIRQALEKIAGEIERESGIKIPVSDIVVKESHNKRNRKTFQATIRFTGPLGQPKDSRLRIKFDITNDEVLVDGEDMRAVFHPYGDLPSSDWKISCYSINEILGEKSRALYERSGTPRDIFDIVNIYRNFREDISPERANRILIEKFNFKGLPKPSTDLILKNIDNEFLSSAWNSSLAHQLQALPPVEDFLADLRPALAWWIESVPVPQVSPIVSPEPAIPKSRFSTFNSLQRLGIGAIARNVGSYHSDALDLARFAARNHLVLEFSYKGINRVVEPYSLRRPATGNLLLYCFEQRRGPSSSQSIKAFNVAQIMNVKVSATAFTPRYTVEL